MKKVFAILLAMLLVFSLAACGSEKDVSSDAAASGETQPAGDVTESTTS